VVPLLDKNFTSHPKNHYYFKNLCLIPKNTVFTRFTLYRVHGLIIKSNPFKYPEEVLPMTKLLAFILITFLVAGAANAKGCEEKKKVGEYEAEVKTDRSPPVIGDNNIEIGIKEAEGGANIFTSDHRLPGVP